MDVVSGDNFNIFKVLKLSTSEVRTHSAFLAELLNAQGEHLQGSIFLDLFLETLNQKISSAHFEGKFNNFISNQSNATAEFFAGIKTDESGGYIDILIEDKIKNKIIIENKIYAGDQEKQLFRYHHHDQNALLIYLTLEGHEASEYSTNNVLQKDIHYITISYINEIIQWLEKCQCAMVEKPIIRETIKQYLILIKSLTHQSKTNKMDTELIELLLKNDNYESALLIGNAIENLRSQIDLKISASIGRQFKEKYQASEEQDEVLLFKYNEYFIYYRLSFEGGEYRFYIMPWKTKFGCATEKDVVAIQTALRGKRFEDYYLFYNMNYSAWVVSKVGIQIRNSENFLKLYDQETCDKYVKDMIEEGEVFRNHVLNVCKDFIQ